MAGKRKAEFRVGQRVKFTLEGQIRELREGYAFVQIVVREGNEHVFRDAVLYLDELRETGKRP